MFSRLLTVALLTAGTALAFSTAQAQTSGTGSSTMPKTTTPSTGSSSSTMGSGSSSTTGSGSSGVTMGSGSGSKLLGSGSGSSTQQAQQPMSSGSFSAKNFKTKTECLNAASAQHADRALCDSLK